MRSVRSVALFVPSLTIGGAERVMLNLAGGFAEHGVEVDLLLSRLEGPLSDSIPPRVRVVILGGATVPASLPRLVRYLRTETPDSMVSALDHANVTAIVAKQLSRVTTKVAVTVHRTLAERVKHSQSVKERILPLLVRMTYPLADGVIAVSSGVAEDLVRIARVPRQRVRIIHNPVVTPELLEMARVPANHPWFTADGPPIVFAGGRLSTEKDFPTLIRAFAIVHAARPVRLAIFGDGQERQALARLIADLDLQEDAILLGFVDNPYSLMTRASVFVLSSTWEGLPTVLIEALACGTPVVAIDCRGGAREILGSGKFGKLVAVGDVKALANAILDAIHNRPEREILTKRADDFSRDMAVQGYLEVLSGMM